MAGGIDKKVDWVASGNQSLHREALEVLGLSSRN